MSMKTIDTNPNEIKAAQLETKNNIRSNLESMSYSNIKIEEKRKGINKHNCKPLIGLGN